MKVLGRSMDSSTIEEKLRALDPAFSFDAGIRRPSEYQPVGQWTTDYSDTRMGIYHNGRYICAMDRGTVPEHRLQEQQESFVEIPMSDVERRITEDPQILYVQILPSDPLYHEALLAAQRGDDNYHLDADGKVFRYTAVVRGKVPGRVILIGWRAMFCTLVEAGLVTKPVIEREFGVRL